jgi:hypothetical protein
MYIRNFYNSIFFIGLLKIYNNINNMSNSQNINMIKSRHKSIRKIIIYNIGTSVVDYVTTKCNNVLKNRNKITPIEDDKFIKVC